MGMVEMHVKRFGHTTTVVARSGEKVLLAPLTPSRLSKAYSSFGVEGEASSDLKSPKLLRDMYPHFLGQLYCSRLR